jgi:hypothetical protein
MLSNSGEVVAFCEDSAISPADHWDLTGLGVWIINLVMVGLQMLRCTRNSTIYPYLGA